MNNDELKEQKGLLLTINESRKYIEARIGQKIPAAGQLLRLNDPEDPMYLDLTREDDRVLLGTVQQHLDEMLSGRTEESLTETKKRLVVMSFKHAMEEPNDLEALTELFE